MEITTNDQHLPVRGTASCGTVAWEATWDDQTLQRVRLRLPDRSWMEIRTRVAERPLFGLCDAVYRDGEEEPITYFRAVRWSEPENIPPLEQPGSLPGGAGAAILNWIALLAQHTGGKTLRYVGPYPTGALFDSLHACFRVEGDPVEAFSRFVAGVEELALQAAMREVPVDFVPAPFVPRWPAPNACVHLRDEPERLILQGRSYHRWMDGPRRLRQHDDSIDAVVELGGTVWATVARLERDGRWREGPLPLPEVPSAWVDQPLHPQLRRVMTDALPSRAPALLQDTLRDVLQHTPLLWGDTGVDAATVRDDTIVLHAFLAQRAQELPPERALHEIAKALEPVAQRLAQQRLVQQIEGVGSK